MKVNMLSLENFRNINKCELKFGSNANIIFGDNAQGKTNILEAIWIFCGARSFRGAKDQELRKFNSEYTKLNINFDSQNREQKAEIIFSKEKKKLFLNDIKKDSTSAFSGIFCAVVFSPDQLSMVKQGPELRRKFLDNSLCQILPKYQKILESYERILRQRSFLLKDVKNHNNLNEMLEVWDAHLIDYGAYISDIRNRYIIRLDEVAKVVYEGIASGKEQFEVKYKSSCGEYLPTTRDEWKKIIKESLKSNLNEDIRMGSTTTGPHRDDLNIIINENKAKIYASQGQQRSAVLALKLAECELIAQSVGEQPIVLLDDVMSELDESRRNYLLNHLNERQVFITCCDSFAFETLKNGQVFHIIDGVLQEK